MSVIIRLPCLGCNIFCSFLLVLKVAVPVGVCILIVVVLIIVIVIIVLLAIKRRGTKRTPSGTCMLVYKMLEMIYEFIGMHCCAEPPVELYSYATHEV